MRIGLLLVTCLSALGASGQASQSPVIWPAREIAASSALIKRADAALQDVFEMQGVSGNPTKANTQDYDWNHRGPRNDKEWAWFLNRHRFFEDLYGAYKSSGDARYAEKLFSILSDWIRQYKTPPRGMSFSSAWRPLEAARRILESWDIVYLELWNDPLFPEELRGDFLVTLENHGDYLQQQHALYGNHLITEMLALLKLSILLPEAKNSARWQDYALKKLETEYAKQFYPEGTHKELSSHYQRVVVLNFQLLLNLLEIAQLDEQLKIWQPRVEQIWDYFKAIQKPNGMAPLNNDSDLENIANLLKAHTGTVAAPPAGSRYFPNAGHVVLRDQVNPEEKIWAFFDIGPRGTDHQHEDFLHLSLSLDRQDLLVDNGRYTYKPGPWRDYFQGPRSHNVLLLDGRSSAPQPNASTGPLPGAGFIQNEAYTAAWGSSAFKNAFGSETANWQRSVLLLPGVGLLVIDHLITFQAHALTGFWHAAPKAEWQLGPDTAVLSRQAKALILSEANSSGRPLLKSTETGRIEPTIQGWHSARFNHKEAAPCLQYQMKIDRPTTFAWLFSPLQNDCRLIELKQAGHTIELNYRQFDVNQRLTIELPIGSNPLKLDH